MGRKADDAWISDDITFCNSKCQRRSCFRHPSNIRLHNIPHSFSDLEGTEYCPFREKKEKKT